MSCCLSECHDPDARRGAPADMRAKPIDASASTPSHAGTGHDGRPQKIIRV
jgi:hypothetical protein